MAVEIHSPFPVHCLPRVWQWMAKFRDRVADDFAPKTLEEFVTRTMQDFERQTTWGVYRDGELGGLINFQQYNPHVGTAHCLFRPDFWGRSTTRPAVAAALREMFEAVDKLSVTVFADNKAIRALLAEFGARVEATLARHTLRGGKPVDMVVLAIFKEDVNYAHGGFDSGNHRSRSVDRGLHPVEQVEDKHQHEHEHADILAGNATVA